MPELGGVEFVKNLRATGNSTPVVFISASKDRYDLIKALKLGVHDFIEKPFKIEELEMAVHRTLEMSVRSNALPELILKFGADSCEVMKQRKLIGLLQAISLKIESK